MFLRNFDFLSPEITLFYKGNERHSSISSGIITLLLFFFIIFLINFLSIDFIFKKNPSAFFYNKYIENLDIINLNSNGIFHFVSFFLNNPNNNIFIDKKAISIIGSDIPFNDFYNDNNISKFAHYIYEKCNDKDAGDLLKNFNDQTKIYFKYGYCLKKYYNNNTKTIHNIDEKNIKFPYLQYGASNQNNLFYGIYIQKCQNHSQINNNSCYDNKTIEKYLSNNLSAINIQFIDSSINVLNYKKPIDYNYHRISNTITNLSFTANHLNFHSVKLRTNIGFFLDKITEIFTFKYDSNEKIVKTSNLNILGTFHFWVQNEMDIYERIYKKVQDIAGGVDGIVEVFMLLIKIFNLLIFHNFQVIHDFNNEIERNIKKFNKINSFNTINLDEIIKESPKNKFNFSILNFKKENLKKKVNFSLRKKSLTKISENNPNSGFKILNNNYINYNYNEQKSNITNRTITKIEKTFQKINRFDFICDFRFKFKKNKYLDYLIKTREKIISEENLINQYLNLKKIKIILVNLIIYINKNNKLKENSFEFGSNNKFI